MALHIDRESPLGADLDDLFARHAAQMHADTPPGSVHTLPRDALDHPSVAFFVIRDDGHPVAMGAIKDIGGQHAEIKSMHVLSEQRRRGLSRMLLTHLTDHARRHGFRNLSLETGAQPSFGAARGLYAGAGFSECPPFGDYRPDPHSVFMTVQL